MQRTSSAERARAATGYGLKTEHVPAADGTRIAVHTALDSGAPGVAGRATGRATVVLTNGLGTTANFWRPLTGSLLPDHTVVHWDHRGHGSSGVPRPGNFAMATLAGDLERVTERVSPSGGPPAVHVAFSMGVTVLLELYRRRPDLVRAMVLVAGGADHPYAAARALRAPGVRPVVRGALRLAAPVVPGLAPVIRRASRSRLLYPAGRSLGLLNDGADRDDIEHFLRSVGSMDLGAYWGILRALLEARGSDVLPTVRVPVLVVAPERDFLAPRADLEVLRTRLPEASWLSLPGTGHAVLLEAGSAVGDAVRRFVGGLG
jgi:pimeloyl-ACP methyl ester carboxylesterase